MKSRFSIISMTLAVLLGFSITASCSSNKQTTNQQQTSSAENKPSQPAATQTTNPESQPATTPITNPDSQSASSTQKAKQPATPPHAGRVSATEVREKLLCPEWAELSKKGLFWGAPGGWRSYSQSFVNEVVSFVEAQWHGVNVGKIMCVYVGKEKRSFPVVLQSDLLVKMPVGYKWGDLKEGVVRCKSTNINDCPYFYKKRDVDIKKVYEELDFKKGQKDLN